MERFCRVAELYFGSWKQTSTLKIVTRPSNNCEFNHKKITLYSPGGAQNTTKFSFSAILIVSLRSQRSAFNFSLCGVPFLTRSSFLYNTQSFFSLYFNSFSCKENFVFVGRKLRPYWQNLLPQSNIKLTRALQRKDKIMFVAEAFEDRRLNKKRLRALTSLTNLNTLWNSFQLKVSQN